MKYGACELKLFVLDIIHRSINSFNGSIKVEDISKILNVGERKVEEVCQYLLKAQLIVVDLEFRGRDTSYNWYLIKDRPSY